MLFVRGCRVCCLASMGTSLRAPEAGQAASGALSKMRRVTTTVTSRIISCIILPSRCPHPLEPLANALYQTQMFPIFARLIGRNLKTLILTMTIILLGWPSMALAGPLGQLIYYFGIDDPNLYYSQLPSALPELVLGLLSKLL